MVVEGVESVFVVGDCGGGLSLCGLLAGWAEVGV